MSNLLSGKVTATAPAAVEAHRNAHQVDINVTVLIPTTVLVETGIQENTAQTAVIHQQECVQNACQANTNATMIIPCAVQTGNGILMIIA